MPHNIISETLLHRLQVVQNSAARLMMRARKREHITPILFALHWLHPIQDPDTGLPLSEPTGSSLPVNVHHAVRPRSLPTIFRPRFTHRTSIPSGALRPPLFHRCRPSSVERTADPSERMPILPVLQGHTKN